jgi:tetratricopeptide (TPR) repeat protein
VQEAVPFVEEVLATQPDHPEAIRLYTQLYGQPPARSVSVGPEPASQGHQRGDALPSYDIEGAHASRAFTSGAGSQLGDVDDPFAEEAAYGKIGDLPSFALDEALAQDLDGSSPDSGARDIEQILDDADWMVQNGQRAEARVLLEQQLRRNPSHPLLLEKLDELDQLGADLEQLINGDRSHINATGAADADELESSFRALDRLEMNSSMPRAPAATTIADVDAVFAQFKAGVRSQVEETDSATHYDLGVAYKEMGLVADALKEFGLAARDPSRECMCHAMIGLIHLEQNEVEQAIEAYSRGLSASQKTAEQELSLFYDLGIAHEMKGDYNSAAQYFREIARNEPTYRDVIDRINALEHPGEVATTAKPARAVNAEEDFERAFDDIFGN